MTRAGLLKLLGRCIAWGFAIEAPILALFLSLQDRMHISIIPGILFVFHLPSYYLTRVLLAAFRAHISTVEYNWLGASLMGCLQATIIGTLIFLARLKNYWNSRSADSSSAL